MRRLSVLLFFVAVAFASVCFARLTVLSFKGALAVPFAVLKERFGYDIELKTFPKLDALVAQIAKGEGDILATPTNVGAILYNRGFDVRLLCCYEWKALYIVGTEPVESLKDLIGKEVYFTHSKGALPYIMVAYILKHTYGVDPEKINARFAPPTELVGLLARGKAKLCVLPEPFVSVVVCKLGKKGVRVLLDVQKEWAKVFGKDEFPAGIVLTRKKVDEGELERFCELFEEAVSWVAENPDKAGKIAQSVLGMPAPVLAKAIPNLKYRAVRAKEAEKDIISFYRALLEVSPGSVGGKIPAEDFFGR